MVAVYVVLSGLGTSFDSLQLEISGTTDNELEIVLFIRDALKLRSFTVIVATRAELYTKYGIRVNAVAPGVTKTTMLKDVPARMLDPVIQMIPLKRIGESQDIANAITFLASDEASYVSGAVLNVDGLVRF